jgi:hypothetical protein
MMRIIRVVLLVLAAPDWRAGTPVLSAPTDWVRVTVDLAVLAGTSATGTGLRLGACEVVEATLDVEEVVEEEVDWLVDNVEFVLTMEAERAEEVELALSVREPDRVELPDTDVTEVDVAEELGIAAAPATGPKGDPLSLTCGKGARFLTTRLRLTWSRCWSLASDNERIRVRQTKSVRGVRGKNMDARTRVGVYEFKKWQAPASNAHGKYDSQRPPAGTAVESF